MCAETCVELRVRSDLVAEMRDHFEMNDAGAWTFDGIVQMYSMQTVAEPAETWRDLKAHGFDDELNKT